MNKGSIVRISRAAPANTVLTVQGIVHELLAIRELPEVPGAPEVGIVQELLAEGEIDFIAAISYHLQGQEVCFVALHRIDGAWYDLQSQELTIAEVQFAGSEVQ